MRIFLGVSIVFWLMTSCQSEKKFETKTVLFSGFSMEIPAFLKKTDQLHEEASLQYQNLVREYYTVVIEEPIEEFQAMVDIEPYFNENYTADLDGYTKLVLENMLDYIEVIDQSKLDKTPVNGLSAIRFEISGKIDGADVYYHVAYIRGKRNFYQVVSWTLLSNKDAYAKSMRNIVESFKEKE